MTTSASLRSVEIGEVDEHLLVPIEEIEGRGFAGHTYKDYPEPARSYYITYARLERVRHLRDIPPTNLIAQTPRGLGLTISVGIDMLGICLLEQERDRWYAHSRVTPLTPEEVHASRFLCDRILYKNPF